MGELATVTLLVAVVGFTYWDYKRVQKMVVPPPPKPEPLPEVVPCEPEREPTFQELGQYIIDCEDEIESRQKQLMTMQEWAHVKVLIAAGNLDVASKLGGVIGLLIGVGIPTLWPDHWWAAVPTMFVLWRYFLKPFETAYEKAKAHAGK